jgi:hypothetical protein
MKHLVANKLTIAGDFQPFIDQNIQEDKLVFSNLIPLPWRYQGKVPGFDIDFYDDNDTLFLEFSLLDNGFQAKPHLIKSYIDNENGHYWWCRKNWGCINDSADVKFNIDQNTATLWFLTELNCPDEWVYKLNEFYPDLIFHHESLTVDGIYGRRHTDKKEIIPGGVWQLSGEALNKLNCIIKF